MFINIGDGGNREGLNDFLDPQPVWSAVREPSYGHGAPDHKSRKPCTVKGMATA